MHQVRQIVPQSLKPHAERLYRRMYRRLSALDRKLDKRTLPQEEFTDLLVELGVTTGATVIVHSSMDEIARRVPRMTALRVIQILQNLLGQEGTLLMPTFPFLGRQLDYVTTNPVFNPRKTASKVGLITECFRRMPGVVRSLHPTHSVAAWGKHARELTGSHHLGGTFGENSPYCKVQQFAGLVIGLGVRLRRMSIVHAPEELHSKTREFVFEAIPRVVCIAEDRTETPYQLFAMRAGIARNYERVEKLLLRNGTLKYLDRGGLRCAVVQAETFIRSSLDLINRDLYFFD